MESVNERERYLDPSVPEEDLSPRERLLRATNKVSVANESYEALCQELSDVKDLDSFSADEVAFGLELGYPKPQFPVEVTGIHLEQLMPDKPSGLSGKPGDVVKVRPCSGDGKDATHLGIYLGDLPIGVSTNYNQESGVLTVSGSMGNPAILVPALGRIVWGCGSWWSKVNDLSDLKDITNEDIDNIPYVLALKAMSETDGA